MLAAIIQDSFLVGLSSVVGDGYGLEYIVDDESIQ